MVLNAIKFKYFTDIKLLLKHSQGTKREQDKHRKNIKSHFAGAGVAAVSDGAEWTQASEGTRVKMKTAKSPPEGD